MELPQKLYKYRPLNFLTLRNLMLGHVYYASPSSFNDPSDCNPEIAIDVSLAQLEQLYCQFPNYLGDQPKKSLNLDELRAQFSVEDNYQRHLLKKIKESLRSYFSTMGVLSLGANWDCALMWSHYAKEHRGICIEYDTTELTAEFVQFAPKRVLYEKQRSIHASSLYNWIVENDSSVGIEIETIYFFHKAKCWEYEKEWREIVKGHGISFGSSKPISAIHFGSKCEYLDKAILIKALNTTKLDIVFFEVSYKEASFDLKREMISAERISDFLKLPSESITVEYLRNMKNDKK